MNELEMRKVIQSFEQFQDQRIFRLEKDLNSKIKEAQDSARLHSEETLSKFKRPFFQKRLKFFKDGSSDQVQILKSRAVKTFRPLNQQALDTARARLMQRSKEILHSEPNV